MKPSRNPNVSKIDVFFNSSSRWNHSLKYGEVGPCRLAVPDRNATFYTPVEKDIVWLRATVYP